VAGGRQAFLQVAACFTKIERWMDNFAQAPVKEITTDKVYYVGPKASVQECLVPVIQQSIRHLLMLKNGKLVGLTCANVKRSKRNGNGRVIHFHWG
jgi:signal-transduction protein with cAMP-binding, CBS, and nucleotidyltransferase domain